MTKTVEYTDEAKSSTLDSSVLANAWYNKDTKDLFVQFHHGGIAGYRNVSEKDWKDLVNPAYSTGVMYNKIKNSWSVATQNGDVNLVAKKVPATGPIPVSTGKNKYRVGVQFDGVVSFTVEADSDEDAMKALSAALDNATKNSTFKIKELTRVFV